MKIRIWNYRSISNQYPIEFEIDGGIIFILGINNVGKSNLLRFFSDARPIIQNCINHNPINDYIVSSGIYFDEILNRNSNELNLVKFEVMNTYYSASFEIRPLPADNKNTKSWAINYKPIFPEGDTNGYNEFFNNVRNIFLKSIYIPSIRIGYANTPDNFDIKTGSAFFNNWNNWATGSDVEKRAKIKRLIKDLKVLFNCEDFDISINSTRNNLLITYEGYDYELTDMGSGLSQFIFILGNVLFNNPSIILIDEPEINLHPKLQEVFITSLSRRCNGTLIATTHSIGLARSCGDRIYSLTKQSNSAELRVFGSHYEPTIAQSISELGYSQFVEIGENNILLVEGRTDIKTFREILRKYRVENRFIVISLGGGSFLTKLPRLIYDELYELKRLKVNSISVIVDSNKSNAEDILSEEIQNLKNVCNELGFNFFATCRHSTENYITQEAINGLLGSRFTSLGKYENFNKRADNNKWNKSINWKLVEAMKKEDFHGTELNDFILKYLSV